MKKINVVYIALIDDEGRILLNRRRDWYDLNEEVWEIIGGGIEIDEQPEKAIIREIEEEIHFAIDSNNDNLQLVKNFKFVNEKFDADVHLFKARFPGFEKLSDSNEVNAQDLKLFSQEEVKSLKVLPICEAVLKIIFG